MNNEIAAYNFPAVLNLSRHKKKKKNPQCHQVYIVEVIADDNPSVTPNLTLLYIRDADVLWRMTKVHRPIMKS